VYIALMNNRKHSSFFLKAKTPASFCFRYLVICVAFLVSFGTAQAELTQHFCDSKLMEQSFASQQVKSCCPSANLDSESTQFTSQSCCSIQTQTFDAPPALLLTQAPFELEPAPILERLSFHLVPQDLKLMSHYPLDPPLNQRVIPTWILWGAFLS
jgi:hypothetical protein